MIEDKIVDSLRVMYQALVGEAVPSGMVDPSRRSQGDRRMAYVISEGCLDVEGRTCLDNRPADCVYEGNRMVYIHPDEYIDCGAGEPLCPEDAIYFEPQLPDEFDQYAATNTEFFAGIGSPRGASAVDHTDRDHPAMAALPRRTEKS